MNCKPGDLAIQTISKAGNHGCIVLVGRFIGDVIFLGDSPERNCWEVEYMRPVKTFHGFFVQSALVPDEWLRPISGLPLDEETPLETNVPEALKLALGIESRWSA